VLDHAAVTSHVIPWYPVRSECALAQIAAHLNGPALDYSFNVFAFVEGFGRPIFLTLLLILECYIAKGRVTTRLFANLISSWVAHIRNYEHSSPTGFLILHLRYFDLTRLRGHVVSIEVRRSRRLYRLRLGAPGGGRSLVKF